MPDEKHDEKHYVLVIKNKWVAYGPFTSRDDAEYAALKSDIAEHGILVPVIVDVEGIVLDGFGARRCFGRSSM
jgi:ParB-like chromosome segregation protein Spo0J